MKEALHYYFPLTPAMQMSDMRYGFLANLQLSSHKMSSSSKRSTLHATNSDNELLSFTAMTNVYTFHNNIKLEVNNLEVSGNLGLLQIETEESIVLNSIAKANECILRTIFEQIIRNHIFKI